MFETNATTINARKTIPGVPEGCEKIMVTKCAEELPSWWKYIPEYSPQPRSKVIVEGYSYFGKEVFLRVRIIKNWLGEKATASISARQFRTIAYDKLRQRLLPRKSDPKIAKILQRL